jgi:formate dehydrogenase major subunit
MATIAAAPIQITRSEIRLIIALLSRGVATSMSLRRRALVDKWLDLQNTAETHCRMGGVPCGHCVKRNKLGCSGTRNEGVRMKELTRRQFLQITGATLAGSSLALMGFSPSVAVAEVREFKLLRTTETRNTCPYCAVACGIVMYGLGDGSKNAEASIIHIEGDPDHPVNRGTLCPKGAGLLDFVHSPSRLLRPEYRAPGSDKWQPISWDDALGRIAKLMKEDRDANFVAKTPEGVMRSFGVLAFDNQARV